MIGAALKRIAEAGEPPADVEDVYGRLIGSWRIESTWYEADGGERSGRGEWHFDRILGGRGVQDVLFADGSAPHEYGTSVRTYDAGSGVWRVVWMQPVGGEFAALVGRSNGEEIIQEGRPLDASSPRRERWRFINVTDDSFTWLGEVSVDDGVTWRLEQRMEGSRIQT